MGQIHPNIFAFNLPEKNEKIQTIMLFQFSVSIFQTEKWDVLYILNKC